MASKKAPSDATATPAARDAPNVQLTPPELQEALASLEVPSQSDGSLEAFIGRLPASPTEEVGYWQLMQYAREYVDSLEGAELSAYLRKVGAAVDAQTPLAAMQQLTVQHLELAVRRVGAKKRAPKGKGQAELAEAREMVKNIDVDTLLSSLEKAGADIDEDMTLDELQELGAHHLSKTLLKQKKRKVETPEEKLTKRLARKNTDELRVMLLALQVTFDDNATAKELRQLARDADALQKWDALKPEERLKWTQMLAIHNARLHDAKQANDRAEMRQKVSDRRQAEREEKGMHHELAPKPEWEVEWGPDEEEEALERLSRLPLWKTMTPQMLDNMMKSIRSNPQVLDAFEAETKNMLQIQEMKGPDGEMPSQDLMRSAGMDFDVHRFKDNEKKAEAAAATATVASA